MGRQAKFSEEGLLDAALCLVAGSGPGAATISALGEVLGAPVGSIYHRFASRDLLLATLWVRTVRRFQQGFLAALAGDDVAGAAVDTALHTLRWSRWHLDEARVLLLYRREDLAARWPTELGDALNTLNDDVTRALRSYTARRFGDQGPVAFRRVTLALVDVPHAAVRRHLLAGDPPPTHLDDLITTTTRCLLDLDVRRG